MAEDTVNQALLVAGLDERECVTKKLRVHGWLKNYDRQDRLHYYGSDAVFIRKLVNVDSSLGRKLHEDLPYTKAEVLWAVREEMARTVEDFLARRSRALFLDARASIEMATEVARLMAIELNYDDNWQKAQISDYTKLAADYLLA